MKERSTPAELRLVPRPVGKDADEELALIARARSGDQAAFAGLFRRHHGRVRGMCSRLLARQDEVEDAVQTTFMEAWRCLPRFEGRSRFSTWLTRVAIHTCFSVRRRLRRWVLPSESDALDEVIVDIDDPSRPASPLANAERFAREHAIAEVLGGLSPKKRTVLVLADYEGMSSMEIGEILGVPDATVRTRLLYARREFAARVRAHPRFAELLDSKEGTR